MFVDFSRKVNVHKNSSLICLSPNFIELVVFWFPSILKALQIVI